MDESVLHIKGKTDSDVQELNMERGDDEEANEAMWYLYVDMYCLDYDGNVFDACLIALLAALQNGNITHTHTYTHTHTISISVCLCVVCL